MIRILKESETKREAIFAREDPVGSVEEPVREIIAQVRAKGDEALKRYTKEFDGVDITSVEVGQGAIDEGFRMADPMLVDILYRASGALFLVLTVCAIVRLRRQKREEQEDAET